MEQRKLQEQKLELEKLKSEKENKITEFTKQDYDYFCNNCMFSELQEQILADRIKDLSIIELSLKYNISTSKVNRELKKIKDKIKKVL